jgi:hypothetical protein
MQRILRSRYLSAGIVFSAAPRLWVGNLVAGPPSSVLPRTSF